MDTYKNYAELSAHETEGVDYEIETVDVMGRSTVIVSPHGGGIEPGTSEIAEAIAETTYQRYDFAGIKSSGNSVLHITSTNFDEPRCLNLIGRSSRVITVHGKADDLNDPPDDRDVICMGGLDMTLRERLTKSLEASGFDVQIDPSNSGTSVDNICNRGRTGEGVQLELSNTLRQACFESLSRTGRTVTTNDFDLLVAAIRKGL